MKNKRSFRLIAWLLAMVMILNIAPLSAFAAGEEGGNSNRIESNQKPSPDLGKEDGLSVVGALSQGTPPGAEYTGSYTVQYVIKGDYTYSGNNLLVKTETATGNPAGYGGAAPEKCEFDNSSSKTWDESSKTLTLYCKPLTCTVELRYMVVYDEDDGLHSKTFQMLQNGEGNLSFGDGPSEQLEVKNFIKDIEGYNNTCNIVIDKYYGTQLKLNQLLHYDLPSNPYLELDTIQTTNKGNDYGLEYYGYHFGSESIAVNGEKLDDSKLTHSADIDWSYPTSKISLYFRLKAVDDTSTYHTIHFVNYDGTELSTIRVKEGKTPAYGGSTPVKPDDDQYSYTFSGWDPEVIAATGDATYTAQYTPTEKSENVTEGNVTFTFNLVLASTTQTRYDYHTTIRLSGQGTNENGQYDNNSNVISWDFPLSISQTRYSIDKNTNGNAFPAGREYKERCCPAHHKPKRRHRYCSESNRKYHHYNLRKRRRLFQ